MEQETGTPAGEAGSIKDLGVALERLVAAGTLSVEQADAVRREVHPTPADAASLERSSWTPILAEIGGYVGGAFVFGAAAVLLGNNWGDLGTPARVAVLALPAAALVVAAVIVARATPGRWSPLPSPSGAVPGQGGRRRMVSVFVTVAAVLAAGACGVLNDSIDPDSIRSLFAAATTALVITVAGYLACRTELLHLAIASSLIVTALTGRDTVSDLTGTWTGSILLAVALLWAVLTATGLLRERAVGYGLAGALCFAGGETLVEAGPSPIGYAVLVVLAVAGLAGFAPTRLIMVLVVGVATLAVVVPQAVIDATDGALGASGALLVVGLSIVGASVLGMRLHRAPPEGAP